KVERLRRPLFPTRVWLKLVIGVPIKTNSEEFPRCWIEKLISSDALANGCRTQCRGLGILIASPLGDTLKRSRIRLRRGRDLDLYKGFLDRCPIIVTALRSRRGPAFRSVGN